MMRPRFSVGNRNHPTGHVDPFGIRFTRPNSVSSDAQRPAVTGSGVSRDFLVPEVRVDQSAAGDPHRFADEEALHFLELIEVRKASRVDRP